VTIPECQAEVLAGLKSENHPSAGWYETRYAPAEQGYWAPLVHWADSLLLSIDSVLDVGAAYGTLIVYVVSRFEPKRRVIVDAYRNLSKSIAERYHLDYLDIDVERDDLPGGKFDLVLFTEVLEHLNFSPIPTLRKIRDALSDSGVLMLTTPDAQSWGRRYVHYDSWEEMPIASRESPPRIDGHIWHYSEEELAKIFELSGLSVLKFERSTSVGGKHLCYLLTRKPEAQ